MRLIKPCQPARQPCNVMEVDRKEARDGPGQASWRKDPKHSWNVEPSFFFIDDSCKYYCAHRTASQRTATKTHTCYAPSAPPLAVYRIPAPRTSQLRLHMVIIYLPHMPRLYCTLASRSIPAQPGSSVQSFESTTRASPPNPALEASAALCPACPVSPVSTGPS